MKTIVIYKSNTGFTKKYAEWIGEELECEVIASNKVASDIYSNYDLVIYGSSLMAGKIKGLDKVKPLVSQHFIVFFTGLTSQNADNVISKVKNDNLSIEEQERIPFYYFEGGLDYEHLGFLSKRMLKMIYSSLKKNKNRTDEETGMMKALESSYDNTNKEYIKDLVEKVKAESV